MGLVLERFFPKQNKVSILSQNHGKLIASANPNILDFLWPASSFYFLADDKNPKILRIEQAWRKNVQIISCVNKTAWLFDLARFCSKIFPENLDCAKSFQTLRDIFEFDWNSLDPNFNQLTQKACLASILEATGLVYDQKIELLSGIFQIIVISKVDPTSIPGLKFIAQEFEHYNFDSVSVKQQIESGLDKAFYPYFFKLINQKSN